MLRYKHEKYENVGTSVSFLYIVHLFEKVNLMIDRPLKMFFYNHVKIIEETYQAKLFDSINGIIIINVKL